MRNLIAIELFENKLKIFILFSVSFLLAVAGMFWFAQREIIYQTVDIFKAYGLTNKVVVFEGAFASNESVAADANAISSLKSVDIVEPVNYQRDYNCLDPKEYDYTNNYGFYLYKLPSDIKYNPFKMIEGRLPKSPNEIMVSSNLSLRCGDKLYDYATDYRDIETGLLKQSEHTVPVVTVVGIFDLNNQMPFNPGWTFKGDYDGSWDGTLGNDVGYAFCLDIIDSLGNQAESDTTCLNLIITPKEGCSTSDVVNEIYDATGLTAFNLDSYTKYVEDFNSETLMTFRSISLILATILITVNVSYGVISLSINKRKMAIYYIHGLSWAKTVVILSFIYLPFVLIGAAIGFVLYACKGSVLLWEYISTSGDCAFIYSPAHIVPVATIILFSYMLINLSFCLVTGRKTPADLVRRE